MPISSCTKIFIAVASLVGLAILVIAIERITHYSASPGQNCTVEVTKCKENDHVYHLESQQCLQNGQSYGRLCGINMVISPLMTCRMQGICECDYDHNDRHLVYDDGTDQCYPIYSQGPCEDGYVVTISWNGKKLKCSSDICVDEKTKVSSTGRDSIVPYKNKCYALSTELDEPGCKGQLKFYKTAVYPSCSEPPALKSGSFSRIFASRCEPGSVQAFRGGCQPTFSVAAPAPDED